MKDTKYNLVLLLLFFLIVAAFTVKGLMVDKSEKGHEIKTPVKLHDVDHSLEIKEVLAKYDSLISNQVKETGTIGAAVIVTYKNQIAFLKCFGVKKKGEKDSIDENTIFRLASVSKTVSGVLAGIMDDENTIRLDDRVVDYIPGFRLKNSQNTENITIRNILSHTSGLIPHAYDNLVEEHVPLSKILNMLSDVDITAPPGEVYSYQNVMFSIYDTVLATKTSKPFGDLIHEKVFSPFHMENASAGFEAFKQNNDKAYPHYGSNGKFRTLPLNNRYYSTMPAAGIMLHMPI